jgi:hypothetical protein
MAFVMVHLFGDPHTLELSKLICHGQSSGCMLDSCVSHLTTNQMVDLGGLRDEGFPHEIWRPLKVFLCSNQVLKKSLWYAFDADH